MPFLVAALLVVAVHAATALVAWRLDEGLAVSSAMHCGTALLWFVLVRRLCGSTAAALATAVVFAGWPGHSEVTHGISARAAVQGVFFLALALVVHDVALAAERAPVRRSLLVLAAIAAGIATAGAASGAAIVVAAAALSWMRTRGERRPARALASTAPMFAAVIVGLNFGKVPTFFGMESPSSAIDGDACVDWLTVLLAPVHHGYGPANMSALLAALTGTLLVVGLSAIRLRAARGTVVLAALVLALGLVAGLGHERLDPATLQHVRLTYLAALGLCTLLGVGIAMLPLRARGPALAIVVVVHALALDQNRQPWLRAPAILERMLADIDDVERLTQRPYRVLDAPYEHDGAFVMPGPHVSSHEGDRLSLATTAMWPFALHDLARAAADGRGFTDAWLVQWDDGALVPFVLDPRWPQRLGADTSIEYARIARVHPFAGTKLPVHVLVSTKASLRLHAVARAGEREWSGPVVDVAAADFRQPIALEVMLPDDLTIGEAVAIDLVAEAGRERASHALGTTTPASRR